MSICLPICRERPSDVNTDPGIQYCSCPEPTERAGVSSHQRHSCRRSARMGGILKEGNGACCYLCISTVWNARGTCRAHSTHWAVRPASALGSHAGPSKRAHRQPAGNARNHRDGCGFAISIRFRDDQSNANTTIFEITTMSMMRSGHLSLARGTLVLCDLKT
jgi:hypothetical protein